jgi:hypothetical protein
MQLRTTFGLPLLTAAILCSTSSFAQSVQDLMVAHQNLGAQVQRCQMAMNQHLQQMQAAAMRGMLFSTQQPMCHYDQPRLIAQMAYLETLIGRAQGDPRQACEINGTCNLTQYHSQYDSTMRHIMGGTEVTPNGNERYIGPNGSHHFDCGPNYRDVTGPSYMPPSPNCVER